MRVQGRNRFGCMIFAPTVELRVSLGTNFHILVLDMIALEIMICLPSRSLGAKTALDLKMILIVGLAYL